MRKLTGYFLVFILIITTLWCLLVFNIYKDSVTEHNEKADALVVMGASQWNGRPSPALKERLDHALEIYNQGYADLIILTGGIADGETVSESAVGRNYLINSGIPESSILIEEKGHTTLESLEEVSKLVRQENIDTVLFVSHGYHLFRVKKIAAEFGIKDPLISSVPIKNDKKKIRLILRESVIYMIYLLQSGYREITGI